METPRFTMVQASFTGKDGNLYLLQVVTVVKLLSPFTSHASIISINRHICFDNHRETR